MNKIILTSLIALLSSCASPHINVNDYTLSITLENNRTINAYGNKSFERKINLSNINIYQYVYTMDSGPVLTYEDAIVATQYRLNYGIPQIIDIVFTDYNVKSISHKGNIHFFKLTNYHETLYLIVDNMNKKRVKLVYGFDKKTFESLYNAIVNNDRNIVLENFTKKKRTLAFDPETYINSSWNQKNIILDGILTKVTPSLYK